jgi:hypothetical protein
VAIVSEQAAIRTVQPLLLYLVPHSQLRRSDSKAAIAAVVAAAAGLAVIAGVMC